MTRIQMEATLTRHLFVSLIYRYPTDCHQTYMRKLSLTGCSLFFHTNNLLLITKYKGIDPETQNFGGLPPVKTIVGGISFNF